MGGIASITSSKTMLSCRFAPVIRNVNGMPCRSETRWRFVPGLPRFVGSGPVAAPPFWPGCWRCPDRPAPSRWHRRDPTHRVTPGATAPRRQDASRLPVTQPSPAGHAAATAQFLGQDFPWDAALEHEDDPRQAGAIRDTRTATLGPGWLRWQQRFDAFPERVRHEWFGHAPSLCGTRRKAGSMVLIDALSAS